MVRTRSKPWLNGHEICEAADESLDLGLPSAKKELVRFTTGVLKLPWEYWVDVGLAMGICAWREAGSPLAYIRTAAIRLRKTRRREEDRGSHVGDGRKAVKEPEVTMDGPCWTLMRDGKWLDDPTCALPKPRRITQGRIEYCDPMVADSGDDDRDAFAPPYYDRYCFQDWLSEGRAWARKAVVDVLIDSLRWGMKISWLELGKTAGVKADARVLLEAMALTDDGREIRRAHAWNYSRYEKARKKLRRKYPKLAQLILIGTKLCGLNLQ